ncbi:type I secretion system permease/ATPase [Pseudovibrio exalbescens]|uniref:ABC transporter ATP-binding protein n=1 Tax=Pseudovibrio exalbescens TaxID=197461 RepID=A0A1U7JD91_9HYPH|nr:type I secretion system permease/ATPase [Pseudovibrio exalbescens]OKL42611.1 ABC transporter ATP-binding protein [Pseudovibrio exalbescens]
MALNKKNEAADAGNRKGLHLPNDTVRGKLIYLWDHHPYRMRTPQARSTPQQADSTPLETRQETPIGPPEAFGPPRPTHLRRDETAKGNETARDGGTAGKGSTTNVDKTASDARQPSQGGGGTPPTDGGSGGGGGGGGNGSPLQVKGGSPNFRQIMAEGLAVCRKNLMIVFVFSLFVNILVLSIPIYLFQISDRVLTSRSTDTLLMLTIIVLGALAFHVLLDMMRRFILMRTAVHLETRLGGPVMNAAAKASLDGSNREFQALGDLQMIRNFITGSTLLTIFDAPIAPIFVLAVFMIHPQLGMVVCGAIGLLFVVAMINQRLTAVPFSRANAYATRANMQADAMARNSQVINAMGMVPESVMMWGKDTAESLKAQVSGQDRNVVMAGISKMVRLSTQITMLGWGAYLALESQVTGGMVIAASIIASRALAPIEGVIEGWKNMIQARSAYARIRNLLNGSPLNIDRLRLPEPKGKLDVERMLFVPKPSKKVILNGISFSLEPGESLAIIGNSGAGKSTLAKMLVGSITPTAGNIRLDRMDLRNWDPRQLGECIGYLPQDVQLFPATIKANIARMRPDATDAEIFRAAELADIHEMISGFHQGYETLISMDGAPLSGGQKQRIGLARAFYGSPRLMVLDEPNSNLDPMGEQALARAMARAKQEGISVVVITQRPSLLRSVDQIMVLKNGSVQLYGPRDQVTEQLSAAKQRARNISDEDSGPDGSLEPPRA